MQGEGRRQKGKSKSKEEALSMSNAFFSLLPDFISFSLVIAPPSCPVFIPPPCS